MKYLILLLMAAAFATAATAQTKRIAHRSHSGSRHSFTLKGADDFGDFRRATPEKLLLTTPVPEKKKLRAADTVKIIRVKPWKQVKDSLPPAVNPLYTKRTAPVFKKAPAKSK